MSSIKDIAATVIEELKSAGFTVQRYDSYSTNSVYIKMDYGVSHSLRISDHKGKKNLSYKFNLIVGTKDVTTGNKGRKFYGEEHVDKLITDIKKNRSSQMNQLGESSYNRFMDHNKKEGENKRGFWQQARLV